MRKDSPDPEGTAENIRIGAIGTAPQAIADHGQGSETRRAQILCGRQSDFSENCSDRPSKRIRACLDAPEIFARWNPALWHVCLLNSRNSSVAEHSLVGRGIR